MQKRLLTQIQNHQITQITTCDQLINLQTAMKTNLNLKLQTHYKVQGYIVSIEPQNLEDAIKHVCLTCMQSYSQDSNLKTCCDQNLNKMLQCCLALRDQSLNDSGNFLEINLLTYDNNPQEFFPGFDSTAVGVTTSAITQKLMDQYREVVSKVCQVGDNESVYECVLEPLKYMNVLKYRIIDTKINPDILQMSVF